jgi:soluble lytic murein transglycosylase-like protein
MRSTLILTITAFFVGAAPAHAVVNHTVQPGETLWSISAANNLTTRTVAVFNGITEDAHVILGSTIRVPTVAEGAAALAAAGVTPAGGQVGTAPGAPPPAGAYTVQPGDSFSSLAARSGVRAEQVAGVNGLDLNRPLLAGTVIKLPPASAPAQAAAAASGGAAQPKVVPQASPAPTAGRVTADQIHQIASGHGVPGDLAAAIAWQESGFNNAMVSSANARGVMQVMPGTWDWVQRNLSQEQLDPASAEDNVHAGAMYLGQLLRETGGDVATAAAGYYQGLGSVREIGMLPETEQYVANVMALRQRFGG